MSQLFAIVSSSAPRLIVWGILLAIAVLYAPTGPDGPLSMTSPKVVVTQGGAMLLGLALLIRSRLGIATVPRDLLLLVAALVCWWGIATAAAWPGEALLFEQARTALVFGLFVLCAAAMPDVRRAFVQAAPIAGLALAATIIFQDSGFALPGWHYEEGMRLPAGTFMHRNTPAYLLAIALVPALAAALETRTLRTLAARSQLVGVIAAALLLTRCRGAWLAALVGVAVLVVGRYLWPPRGCAPRPEHRPIARLMVYAVAAAASLVLVVAPGRVSEARTAATTPPVPATALADAPDLASDVSDDAARAASSYVPRSESLSERVTMDVPFSSMHARVILWGFAGQMVWESPLLGVGPGGYEPAALVLAGDESYKVYNTAHNELLHAAAELGLPGALLLLGLWVLCLRRCWRARAASPEAGMVLAMLLVLMVRSSLEVTMQLSHFGPFAGILLGAAAALRDRDAPALWDDTPPRAPLVAPAVPS